MLVHLNVYQDARGDDKGRPPLRVRTSPHPLGSAQIFTATSNTAGREDLRQMRARNPDPRHQSRCANNAQVPLSLCAILRGLAHRRGNPESLAKPAQAQSKSRARRSIRRKTTNVRTPPLSHPLEGVTAIPGDEKCRLAIDQSVRLQNTPLQEIIDLPIGYPEHLGKLHFADIMKRSV
jgi:hypothetical protein